MRFFKDKLGDLGHLNGKELGTELENIIHINITQVINQCYLFMITHRDIFIRIALEIERQAAT